MLVSTSLACLNVSYCKIAQSIVYIKNGSNVVPKPALEHSTGKLVKGYAWKIAFNTLLKKIPGLEF